jgi:hypothetical protein
LLIYMNQFINLMLLMNRIEYGRKYPSTLDFLELFSPLLLVTLIPVPGILTPVILNLLC